MEALGKLKQSYEDLQFFSKKLKKSAVSGIKQITLNGLYSVFIKQIFNYSNLWLEIVQYICYCSSYIRDKNYLLNYFCCICTMSYLPIKIVNKAFFFQREERIYYLNLVNICYNKTLINCGKGVSFVQVASPTSIMSCQVCVRCMVWLHETWGWPPLPPAVPDRQDTLILLCSNQEQANGATSDLRFYASGKRCCCLCNPPGHKEVKHCYRQLAAGDEWRNQTEDEAYTAQPRPSKKQMWDLKDLGLKTALPQLIIKTRLKY